MKKQVPIIIKKVKKQGGGDHGGSWKVAYADFITSLMAFFLVMWLISMVSPEKKARLAAYFKHFNLFTESGISFMGQSSEIFNEQGEVTKVPYELKGKYAARIENIKETLKQNISEKLGDIKDQVLVDIVEGGIRIQMVDKEGRSMFELGSAKLNPIAKKVLRIIGENIKSMPNKVTIDGHTDALAYAGSNYTNWELSTERASSARKELEVHGLDPARIARVTGYAATDPLIKENPSAPQNRRISIVLLFPGKDKNTEEITDASVIN